MEISDSNFVIFSFLLLTGVILLFSGIYFHHTQAKIVSQLEQTDAEIIEVSIIKEDNYLHDEYKLNLLYSYEIDGQKYFGTEIKPVFELVKSQREDINEAKSNIINESKNNNSVYYNQKNHDISYLTKPSKMDLVYFPSLYTASGFMIIIFSFIMIKESG